MRPLASGIAALLLASAGSPAQTYTAPGNGTFTNPFVWNFGGGPVPASDPALPLRLQSFGGAISAADDLNLTLQSLDFSGNGTLAIASLLGGNLAFANGAGLVNFGSSATVSISAGVVMSSTLGSLTLDGAGPGGLILSGAIASNTAAGAPLVIALDATNVGASTVTLGGANTFSGGVVLDSGTLTLGHTRALGDRANTLTINGGSIRASATLAIANDLLLNNTLNFDGSATLAIPAPLSLSGVLSGAGGVTQRGAGLGSVLALSGINTYTGATTIRGLAHGAAPLDEAASIHVTGAAGSILQTSAIDVRSGGIFRLDYADGHSAVNARVAAATGITTAGGFLETFGNEGLVLQSLGTVNAGGLTTISANTNGGGAPAAGGATQVTIANLQRAAGGTVTFTGPNLGGTAVAAGLGAAQGNVTLTQLDGGSPSSALIGGAGGAGTSNISILPWALGDTVNDANRYDAGSGFVTYGADGVRLLDPITEYNVSNSFNGLGDNFQNIRIANSVTDPAAPVTVNSIFIDASGLSIGGTNAITIGSGALAMNVDNHTISAPLFFGAGGAGEAIVSVVGPLLTSNTLTLSGQIGAASLVKNGHGTLVLGDPTNVIAGGVTINGGQLSVDAIAALGGATSLALNSPSQSAAGAALTYTGAGLDFLTVPVATNGGMAGFNVTNSSLDVSGAIAGVGGVRKDGPGTLVLSGTNTYSGGTYLGAGTLEFDSDARLGAGGFLHTSGGTLSVTGAWITSRPITIATGNTLVLSKGTNAVTIAGSLDGTGPLQSTGSGTLSIVSGDNGYAGAIALGSNLAAGGALVLSGPGAVNGASIVFGASGGPAGTYALDLSGATGPGPTPWRSLAGLTTTGGFAQAHTVQLGTTALTPVDLRVSTGSFGGAGGVIQGFGKLVKTGPNALTLNGTLPNTFTGGVEVWAGTLHFGADGQLGDGANAIALQGGILNSTANGTTARAITLAATPLPIIYGTNPLITLGNGLGANSGTARTYSGPISGAGGFQKSGAGTVQLAATNSYAGDTQITAGILAFTDSAQLGSASSRIRIGNTGTLRLVAAPGAATPFPLNRNIFAVGSGSIATIHIPAATPTLNLGGQLMASSGAELLLSGAGKFTISADNRSLFAPLHIAAGSAVSNLTLAGTGHLRRATLRIDGVDMTFNMSNLTRDLGAVQNLDFGSSIQLGASGQLTSGFNNSNMAWAGNILGSGTASAFLKVGTGTIALTAGTAASQFPGGFHLLSGSGSTTTLTSNAALTAKTAITIGAWGSNANRGPLLLLNNAAAGNLNTRLADAQSLFSNSGEIQLTTNASTATNEVTGSLRGAGMNTVTMSSGGTLNFSDATNGLTRLNGGTFLFRAGNANMGSAAATTTIANLLFGNSGSLGLIGGGGGSGTTTISILPYGVGGISAASPGTNFVTYGANGIRVLNTTTEVVNHVNAGGLTGNATDNVRFNNSTLTTTTLGGGADRTVNALNLSGTANTTRIDSATTERLIIESGLVLGSVSNVYAVNAAGTAGVPLGLQVAELQTGAGNTRELNVFTTGGDLALGAQVTTTGGLTKSGAGSLYLTNAANSYGGTTSINAGSLVVDDLAALGSGTALVAGGGFLKFRGANATLPHSILAAGGSGAGLGASAGFHIVSGTTLTTGSGSVSGNGGILKDGAGVLRLAGANTHTGATLMAAGALAIDGPGALGGNSRVVFTDSSLSAAGGQTLRFDAPMTLTQDFVVNSAQNGIGFGFDTNGYTVTLTGTALDARNGNVRGLYKFGAGELNLTDTQMYTGPTQVFGGTLRLSGANGSVMNSTGLGGFSNQGTIVVGPGSALVLDNSTVNNPNRLPDVWDTPFGTGNTANGGLAVNGGELRLIGHASGTSERINQIQITAGTISLEGGGTTLTSGQVIRSAASGSSAIFIRGTNLGGTPGPLSANWFVTDLGSGGVQLDGAGGAEGTPFVNILRGGMGDTSATGSGTDLLTYAADTGFRTLTPGEYTSTIPANNFDLNRAPNIALSGSASVDQTTAITALKLGAGATLGGAGTLLLGQSTVLATGNASIDAPSLSTHLASAGPSTIFLTASAATTLTVNSMLPGAAMGKYGEGTLLLNARRIGSGPVALKQGTLTLGAAGGLAPTTQIVIDPGAVFDLGGSDRTVGSLTHDGGTIGTFHLGQISGGSVALGANRLSLYDISNATFSGTLSGSGGLTKAFNSTGVTTFTQPQSYTGSTLIRGGSLQLASAATLASAAVEIRGGTLTFANTDDLAASGYVANRLGVTTPIALAGGVVQFNENANTPGNHSLGAIALEGLGSLVVQNGATAPSIITVSNLTRSAARGVFEVSASNLGLAQSPVGGTRLFLTQIEGGAPSAALIGGGGGVGSTTQGILPWVFSTAGHATYGADGLRPLALSEYEVDLLDAPTSADVNSRITAAQTLTAPRTVNSLVATASGSVSGAFDLTLGSGALAVLGSPISIGTNTHSLLTGAGNTRELFLYTAIGNTALDYNLTTSGGVTKYGPGDLTLGGTNPFIGGLSIHDGAVHFDDDVRLGAAGGAIRFGGSRTSDTVLAFTGADTATLDFTRPVQTSGFGGFTGLASHRWKIGATIAGAGGFRYTGTDAVFEVNAAHSYAGPTLWNGGHLYIGSDAAFGSGGELFLNARVQSDIVLRAPWTSARLVHASTNGGALQTNGHNATWSGQFIGTGAFTKNGIGTLSLTTAMPYAGPLTVAAGEMSLRDRGSLAANGSTLTVEAGGALILDDQGIHASDRLHDSSGTTALNGGALTVLGSSSVTTEEVMNSLALGPGVSTVALSPGSAQSVIVRLSGTVSNAATAASLWRGANLGVNAPGTANSANVLFTPTNTNTFPLVGGGAPAGHPSISIIAGGFGDTSASGSGTQLVTYDPTRGVRLLDPWTEYISTLLDGSSVTDNVKADGATFALPNATTINALWLKDGGSVTGAGELGLRSGNLLVTGSGNTVAKGLVASVNALAIGGPGDVTFTSAIGSSNFGGLVKMGAGTLTLNAASSYLGNTVLQDGVLAVGDASALATSTLHVQGGELRNGSGGPLTLANDLVLSGTMKIGGAQDVTFSGNVLVSNATREIQTTNTGTTTITGVVTNSQSLLQYGLTKTGPGTLVLANSANTYDGPTTIRAGVLSVGTLADGSVGSLVNPSGIGQSWGDADQLVFDGGTLRYTGPLTSTDRLFTLTQNGGTIDASGTGNLTFNNTGAMAAPGAGPRTLTLTGNNTTTNTMAVSLTNGPTLSDATSLTVSTTHWQLTNANTFTGATTVQSGTLEAAAAGALGATASVTINTGGTLLLSGSGNRINNSATINLAGGELDTGGTSEGSASTVGLGTLTLTASSIIDFTGSAATLTFASGAYSSGVLSILNWSGIPETAGTDGVHDRLIFAGDNTARLAFLGAFSQSSVSFAGFGFGYEAIQFDSNFFEVVPVPEPSGIAVGLALLGLAGWRERRRSHRERRTARGARRLA